MREKILAHLQAHPGARKREIAHCIPCWQCDFDFLATFDDLCEDGLIRYETIKDFANMEYYDKWYLVEQY